jgi:hypothetical protein
METNERNEMNATQYEALMDVAIDMELAGYNSDEIASAIERDYGWDSETAEWIVAQAESGR